MVKKKAGSSIKGWLSASGYLSITDVLKVDDYFQLVFVDGSVLSIYNPFLCEGVNFADLKGCTLCEIREDEAANVIVLGLDQGSIRVNVHPDAWTGPEAMALYEQGHSIVIWN